MASAEQRARFQAELERGTKLAQAEKPKPASKRRKGLKQSSVKQAILDARWAGMKAMALYLLGPDAVCGICEQPLHNGDQVDADHIVPRGKGGTYDPENLQLAHRRCHQSTKHRNLPEWTKESA